MLAMLTQGGYLASFGAGCVVERYQGSAQYGVKLYVLGSAQDAEQTLYLGAESTRDAIWTAILAALAAGTPYLDIQALIP